jgi:N-methylhydantoinase B
MSYVLPGSERFETRVFTGEVTPEGDLPMWSAAEGDLADPISFEVIAHKLHQLLDEYGSTIARVSGSVIVSEALDYNVTLSTPSGEQVVTGRGAMYLGTPMQMAIRWILENRSVNPGIEDGDMFLSNDPWTGGSHQPDTTLLAPVFVDGKLFAWCGVGMHMLDLGGPKPTINTQAMSVFEEQVPTPPVKLVRNGAIQSDVHDMFVRRSRLPMNTALDLRAMVAATVVAVTRLKAMIDAYTAPVVNGVMHRWLDDAEAQLRARLLELPDGEWRHEVLHEMSGPDDRGLYRVRGSLRKKADSLVFDMSEADEQTGFISTTRTNSIGGAMAGILPLLVADLPWSIGAVLRVIDFEFSDATLTAANYPAAVCGGPMTGGMAASTLAQVLIAKMLCAGPDHLRRNLTAVTCGALPILLLAGTGREGRYEMFLCTDVLAGGSGARSFKDGDSASGYAGATAMMIPNVESIEEDSPVLMLYRREVRDGVGAGKYQGGAGAEEAVIPYGIDGPFERSVATFGQVVPASAGLSGGLPSKGIEFREVLNSDIRARFDRGELPSSLDEIEGEHRTLPSKDRTMPVDDNTVIAIRWAGGGGYGDPLDRDPGLVARDVEEGVLTEEWAKSTYGVVVGDGGADEEETERLRSRMRGSRVGRSEMAKHSPAPPAEGVKRLDDNLGVLEDGSVICCTCGAELAAHEANYKRGAAMTESSVLEAGLATVEAEGIIDEAIVLRQYSCGECGTLLESAVEVASSGPLIDKFVDAAS